MSDEAASCYTLDNISATQTSGPFCQRRYNENDRQSHERTFIDYLTEDCPNEIAVNPLFGMEQKESQNPYGHNAACNEGSKKTMQPSQSPYRAGYDCRHTSLQENCQLNLIGDVQL